MYADKMLDKVDDVIKDVLDPNFTISHTFTNGPSVQITVSRNGFTRNFWMIIRKILI